MALTLALAAGRPCAAGPTAILSSDSQRYLQALEGFTEAWGSTVPVVAAGAPLPEGAKAFVAFGSMAAARQWPRDAVVVACLAPSVAAAADDAVTHVSLLPDSGTLVSRALSLFPTLRVLRVLWSSEPSRDGVEAIVRAGDERGVAVISERVMPPSGLPDHLRGLRGQADALWLMPDPALVTAENFATIREYAAAQKLPLFAPTEGLADIGATAAIAVTFRDMGRAAALSLRARLAGRPEPKTVHAGRVNVTVNAAAARAIGPGLKLESADKVLP